MASPTQMDDKMKNFLTRFAEGEGRAGDIRWAAEEVIRRSMAMPTYAKYLDDADREAVEAAASAAPAEPETAAPAKARVPMQKTANAKPAAPKVAAPKAAKADVRKTKPVQITIDGTTADTPSWRAAFVSLVEHAIKVGKLDAVPATWIKSAEDRTTNPLSNGSFLYTNHTGEQFLGKMTKLVAALGVPVSITVEPNDGGSGQTIDLAA